MELLDIVDENNILTGFSEERKTIHEKKLWHRHVSCWIMNEKGEILFQKKSNHKKINPGKWAKTGGHVNSGENVEDALLREISSTPRRSSSVPSLSDPPSSPYLISTLLESIAFGFSSGSKVFPWSSVR